MNKMAKKNLPPKLFKKKVLPRLNCFEKVPPVKSAPPGR